MFAPQQNVSDVSGAPTRVLESKEGTDDRNMHCGLILFGVWEARNEPPAGLEL